MAKKCRSEIVPGRRNRRRYSHNLNRRPIAARIERRRKTVGTQTNTVAVLVDYQPFVRLQRINVQMDQNNPEENNQHVDRMGSHNYEHIE